MKFSNSVESDSGSSKQDVGFADNKKGSSSKTNTPIFFGTTSQKNTETLKGQFFISAFSQFQPMQVKSSMGVLTIRFPITHSTPKDHSLDMVDGITPANFFHGVDKGKLINSYLQFKFTRDGDKWFLLFECCSYPEIYDYQLNELLSTFVQKMPHPNKPSDSNEECFRVSDTKKYVSIGHFRVPIRTLITYDDLDFDGVNVRKELEAIKGFNLNCLKRLEELTYKREEVVHDNAKVLGYLLDDMVNNYKAVSSYHYGDALNKLDVIEQSETYQNDPLIFFSLTPVRGALELLSQRAMVSGRGVEIDEQHVNNLLQELVKHEGIKPGNDIWLPEGSVGLLKKELDSFLTFYKHNHQFSVS